MSGHFLKVIILSKKVSSVSVPAGGDDLGDIDGTTELSMCMEWNLFIPDTWGQTRVY